LVEQSTTFRPSLTLSKRRLRFSSTQEIAAEAVAEEFEGIVYRPAQQLGQDCFVVFGVSLNEFNLAWTKALALGDGSAHQALVSAIRGG
jgi:hypothetical protein